jgi:hypothetical protein
VQSISRTTVPALVADGLVERIDGRAVRFAKP